MESVSRGIREAVRKEPIAHRPCSWTSQVSIAKLRYDQHVCCSCGRICSLIGEHIDYCLFGVLPAAVERDILIACAPSDDPFESAITIQNLDGTYSVGSIDPLRAQKDGEWILPIDKTKLDWQSYIKAAYHVRLEFAGRYLSRVIRGLDWDRLRAYCRISSVQWRVLRQRERAFL